MSEAATVIELTGWGLDATPFRPAGLDMSASRPPAIQMPGQPASPSPAWREQLQRIADRSDRKVELEAEFSGLDWRLDIVDLRMVLAFQRRLVFSAVNRAALPAPDDLAALADLTFAPPRPLTHSRVDAMTIVSDNPDLTLRPSADGYTLYGGSPFLEVARFRGRLFLRDGYHRAYDLLRSGVPVVPAVFIEAACFAQTGAEAPWFFPEEVLFSMRPPMLTDFHDSTLTITYRRPRLRKTIRMHMEETFSLDPQCIL